MTQLIKLFMESISLEIKLPIIGIDRTWFGPGSDRDSLGPVICILKAVREIGYTTSLRKLFKLQIGQTFLWWIIMGNMAGRRSDGPGTFSSRQFSQCMLRSWECHVENSLIPSKKFIMLQVVEKSASSA
jgi:hypothetical protein